MMSNFWDFNVWGDMILIALLLGSLLAGNILKKNVAFLQASLIPTSVIGGIIILVFKWCYTAVTGNSMFDTALFGGTGTDKLEIITYHTLALGFIASALKSSSSKLTKKRTVEIFNTGITTVSTYLLQGILGLIITIVAAFFMTDFFKAAGILLPFGYGQGTGQALNYGGIYESEYGFVGGRSFGLTIAALGFLSASIGGVIHLNIMKKLGKLSLNKPQDETIHSDDIQTENEIPMQESVDKITIQMAIAVVAYLCSFFIMYFIGELLPGLKAVIYGFNFLIGVLMATLIKFILKKLRKAGVMKKEYTNNFLLTRISNFFFDVMVVAGVAAIRLDTLEKYWTVMAILGIVGAFSTYFYNKFIADTLFKEYRQEQFLVMYGMLTGTASTGIILLREIDGDFKTPAADNIVYQNFPAMVFGLPMMFLATIAPVKPELTLIILIAFFAVMNLILFRQFIFKKRKIKKI